MVVVTENIYLGMLSNKLLSGTSGHVTSDGLAAAELMI